MPPDISAGLTALAAAPPGAAFSAGPPLPEPLSASLFAAFLAQSSPPTVMPAADLKQTPLEKPSLPKSKTMDTLPALSILLTPKTRVQASELPSLLHSKHEKAAEDQHEDLRSAAGMPIPSLPSLVPMLTGQAAAPLLLAAAVLPHPVPGAAGPAQAVPVSPSRLDTPAAAPLRAASPAQAAPAQAAPAQIEPLTLAMTPGPEQTLEPKAVSVVAAKPVAVQAAAASGLPRIPSPVLSAPQSQAMPQETMPNPSPSAAQAVSQSIPLASPAITVAAAALPAPETPKPSPAKITGKFLPSALKPAGENADTSTRTLHGQAPAVPLKAGAPAAAPEPMPEKHSAEQKLSETAGSGTNSGLPAPPMGSPADVIKTGPKPLTAGERAEVVRQAADGVGAAALPAKPGEAQQMSVQLHPKDWGSLQVSVTVAPSQEAGTAKTVTAHIVAETPQVKAALQSQTGALHQALRASGLHLEHFTVSVKMAEANTPEVKPAAQSASAGFSSGQGQSDNSGQSYGQPNAGSGTDGLANGFANGFGTGGSQNNRQGQPPQAFMPAMADAEPDDAPAANTPIRFSTSRIDTHA